MQKPELMPDYKHALFSHLVMSLFNGVGKDSGAFFSWS